MKLTELKKFLVNAISANDLLSHTNRIKLSAGALTEVLAKMDGIYDGKLVSAEAKSLAKQLNYHAHAIDERKPFKSMLTAMEVIEREAEVLEKMLDNDTLDAVLRDSMNIKEAQVIQFITLSDQTIEYIRALSVCIQEFEIYALRKQQPERNMISYVDRNFSGMNMRAVAQLISFFASKRKEEVVSKIYELPDIKVDETILKTVESVEGAKKIDPAGFNPLQIFNPTFYAFTAQKVWSELKFYRLEKASDELVYLELRLQEIQVLRDGRENHELERKINRYQDRIQTLRSKIERIRAKMG